MKSKVGLGLRHPFHSYVLEKKPIVPWFEVITENYLRFDGAPRSFLHKISELYPLVFHGVSLSIGSLEPVRLEYLQQLKKLILEFKPLWISDHLCWTFNGPENSHDLLPVPFTRESLKRIISKTQQVQEVLGQKIYLENPSAYVDFSRNQYSEEAFISELCEKSGCGLLLDLNNLVVNQYNLGYKPLHYLETIKNCEVRQIHLAGHTVKEQVRIDTHDSDVTQEVLDLLPYAKKIWPEANPMIEWDDKIPPIEYLLEQREKIDLIWNKQGAEKLPSLDLKKISGPSESDPDQKTHTEFWKQLKNQDYVTPETAANAKILKLTCPTPAHVGLNVYSSAYFSRIISVLEIDFPVLKIVLNELFNDVMMEYLAVYPSIYDSIDFVGNSLAKFIAEHTFSYNLGVDQKIISDVAAFENLIGLGSVVFAENYPTLSVKEFTENDWSEKNIKLKSTVLLYKAFSEIHPIIEAVKKNEIPEIPELKEFYYVFYRENNVTHFKSVAEDELTLFDTFSGFKPFIDILDETGSNLEKFSKLLFANESFFCTE